jgi:hypothetical protein
MLEARGGRRLDARFILNPEQHSALHRELKAVAYTGFLEDVHQMDLHGSWGDGQSLGNFTIF